MRLRNYAFTGLGAVCTPANPSYTPRELAHQLGNSQCRAVVVGDGLLDQVSEALLLTEHRVEHVLHLDEARSGAAGSIFELAAEPALEPPALDYAQAAAYLCYSSGTTGKPKGVVLTHANMVANAQQIARVKQLDEPTMNSQTYETFLGLAPFCHAYGLSYVLHSSVMLGGRVVVMRQYSFERFLRAVQRHRITYGYLVPPIVCALSKNARVDAYDVSSMHTVLSGGAALSPALIETAEARLPGTRVVQGYGMSEMSPAMTMLATSHRNHASIGVLLPGGRAKVVDDAGRQLGVGEAGELCFSGPNVMREYLDNPQATREIFDGDGFLRTGDIGHVDADGFFYITDRKKELIKFKGFQVAPSELEGLLAEHPDIHDAAVLPVYDDAQATEVPRGYFVLKPRGGGEKAGAASDAARAQAVADWLHARVAKYKRLRGGVVVVDGIPRSPAGKIIRRSLREIEHI
ncbi:hypothetical protein H4S01_005884 [Coemansia sp. RSA 2610]|nr:hypothetical protein H4S01_005884 [Coemansia sp. RSA 2610]